MTNIGLTLEGIIEQIPGYAYDMKENLKQVLTPEGAPGLTEHEIAAIAIASALASESRELAITIEDFAGGFLSPKELEGAKTAHAIMSMTNVYYRFLHISQNPEYKFMPPKLAMKAEANPGIDKRSFELASVAVSAINFCKACVDYHELNLRRMGVSAVGIQSCVRIASVIKAVGQLLKFK